MRIAYLVNQYPKTSHSFIRRELQAIESCGHTVLRYAIRVPDVADLPDPRDREEVGKTRAVLTGRKVSMILRGLWATLARPRRAARALKETVILSRNSERGLLLHIVYWIEALALSLTARKDDVEHIHAHFGTNSATVAHLLSALTEIPYSFTVHGPEEFDKPGFIGLGRKIESSAFTVAISSFGRGQLMRHVSYDHWNKIKVVHCGLDSAFSDGERPSTPDTNQLVCVGRLCEQKAPLLAVEAVAEVRKRGFDITLLLAGDGELRPAVEARIAELGVEDYVSITGWISSDEVRRHISESRGLVLPSFAEGLPVVIMEAGVLERPVISTYIAGIPELVMPGETGYLVPSGDVEALAGAMIQLIETPVDVLRKMGQAARKRTLERHNIETEAQKLLTHIETAHAGVGQ